MVASDVEEGGGQAALVTAQELEEALARRTFWCLAGFGALILVPVKLAWWLQGGQVVGILGLFELLTLLWCSWKVWRNRQGAGRFLAVGLAIMYAQVAGVAWLQGGLHAPALRWLSVLPIIAIVAGNLRLGLVLCTAFVLQILAMSAHEPTLPPAMRALVLPNPHMQTLVATVGSVMLFSAFGWIAIRWRKQVHEVLAVSHQHAQRGNEAKQRFLATMSHEIRTPLNGIVGTASLLKHRRMAPSEQQQLLHLLDHSSQTLLGLLNDVLDWAKLEAGQLEVHREPLDLRALVVDSVELFAVTAFGKGLGLSHSHDADLPQRVLGDEVRLRQALNNLVSNAIKFTRQGEVHVHVALDQPAGWVRFEVQDSGIGMGPDQLARLFKPFTQGDQSTTRQYGGTGLGLSISRELVRRMGGDILVSSRPGVGSCFVIRVPLADAVPGIGDEVALAAPLPLRRLRLLTASMGLRRQVHALASDLGLEMVPEDSGDAPDAVLVDAAMLPAWPKSLVPGAHQALAVLATAADVDQELPDGVATLFKPLRTDALAAWLGGVSSVEPRAAVAMPDKTLHVLVAEDHELNRTLLREMLDHCQASAQLVGTGLAAVAAVKAGVFDLLLLDYQMPEMDGLSATRLIREHEQGRGLPPVPIVLISGDTNAERHAAWRDAGVDHIMCKPFVYNDLARLIKTLRQTGAGSRPTVQ